MIPEGYIKIEETIITKIIIQLIRLNPFFLNQSNKLKRPADEITEAGKIINSSVRIESKGMRDTFLPVKK